MTLIDRLEEMKENFSREIVEKTEYTIASEERDLVVLDTPWGPMNVFLHAETDRATSKKRPENSFKHRIDKLMYQKQNVTNIFYGDGEIFLHGAYKGVLEKDISAITRVPLRKKERIVLKMQDVTRSFEERNRFEKEVASGRFLTPPYANFLTCLTPTEFGGNIKTFFMKPVYLRYGKRSSENSAYDFVEEKLEENKYSIQRIGPQVKQFKLVQLKKDGRLFVFSPKR